MIKCFPNGYVTIDDREYFVTGHHISARIVRRSGRSSYRTLPYHGPTWWRIMDAIYPDGVKYSDGELVARGA